MTSAALNKSDVILFQNDLITTKQANYIARGTSVRLLWNKGPGDSVLSWMLSASKGCLSCHSPHQQTSSLDARLWHLGSACHRQTEFTHQRCHSLVCKHILTILKSLKCWKSSPWPLFSSSITAPQGASLPFFQLCARSPFIPGNKYIAIANINIAKDKTWGMNQNAYIWFIYSSDCKLNLVCSSMFWGK